MDVNKNKKLLSLLQRAMILLMLTAFIGIGLLWFSTHPEYFAIAVEEVKEREAKEPTAHSTSALDPESGLVTEGAFLLVKSQCTGCHSGKLITQNRATREGWLEMIRWMQETQKLWDLGVNEDAILDYLATYYAPEYKGRRASLTEINWYELE